MKHLLSLCVLYILLPNSSTTSPKLLIRTINSQNASWKAGFNFPEETHTEEVKQRLGFLEKSPDSDIYLESNVRKMGRISIPESFDAREQWLNCRNIIDHIRDQGTCGSSWAFASTEVMSDRLCIQSNGTVKFEFSPEDLMSCCEYCGEGCAGGYLDSAWKYWVNTGIVSGGDYNSNEGCKPYSKLAYLNKTSSSCTYSCTNKNYKTSYLNDVRFGNIFSIHNLEGDILQMQRELMVNGPIEVNFTVYEDFSVYKEGIYQHVTGEQIGSLAVKIVGWGTENELPYWLVANSWGTSFGNLKGYFKIRRGTNECGIENYMVIGTPQYTAPTTTTIVASNTTVTTTIKTTTTTESPGHGSAVQISLGVSLSISGLLLFI